MITPRFYRKASLTGPQGLTGLSSSTLDRLIAAGKFPRPVQLGDRAVAWPSAAIEKWITERSAAPTTGGVL